MELLDELRLQGVFIDDDSDDGKIRIIGSFDLKAAIANQIGKGTLL